MLWYEARMKRSVNGSALILASKSPRRRQLLSDAGLSFSVIPSGIDESAVPGDAPVGYARRLAQAKALDVARDHPEAWVVGADTIVVTDEAILGKPRSVDNAREMLHCLGGRLHRVITGYCICRQDPRHLICASVVTKVWFKTLTAEEIEWYVETREPFGKAGAYAIQGIGGCLVKCIEGSYSNVVGLPVCEVLEALEKEGAIGWDCAE